MNNSKPDVILNSTLLLECLKHQTLNSINEFIKCYNTLYAYHWGRATVEIILATLVVTLNSFVIFILLRNGKRKNLFDKILIGHCIVDGITGLVAIPFFHFRDLFGYWPFGESLANFWAIFDNAINVITNLHMLYMTWVRFRSITAPNTYENEILAKMPKLVFVLIWLIGYIFWIPVVFSYGLIDYSVHVNYNSPIAGSLLIFFSWFLPLSGIIILSVTVLVILNRRTRQKHDLTKIQQTMIEPRNNHYILQRIRFALRKLFHLGPQIRFQIIIISYCLQWFPSCLIAIIDPLCNGCVESNVSGAIYWLTYTVCITDPLVILIFNTNVRARITPHR